ncbi:MAG TPA: HTTM domain-containing protein [Nitriliruptorales bacterium]|nr:HTTM domain-containing protein [Nitriliruptorales bacterium]
MTPRRGVEPASASAGDRRDPAVGEPANLERVARDPAAEDKAVHDPAAHDRADHQPPPHEAAPQPAAHDRDACQPAGAPPRHASRRPRPLAATIAAWDRSLHIPVSTAPLAFVRIALGLVLTGWTLALAPDLRTFFGPAGMLPAQPGYRYRFGLLALWNSDAAVIALWVALLVASLCLTVGLGTRLAALVAFLAVLSFQRRNPWVFNSGDLLVRQLTFFVALAPAGAALSVDRWLRHRHRFWDHPRRAPWPLRLIQLNLALGYLLSVWGKLRGDTWNDGTAIGYALRIGDLQRLPAPGWLTDLPVAVNVLTWGSLTVELAVALLVWNRRLRPWVLAAGGLLHLAIDVFLEVGFFSYAVLAAYLAFVPPDVADRRVARWVAARRLRPAVVP